MCVCACNIDNNVAKLIINIIIVKCAVWKYGFDNI